jgi:hypothetical protein
MPEIDFTFPHTYEIEEMRELPGAGKPILPIIFFPPPENRPEHDGLWLTVSAANGRTWIGVFQFGYSAPPAFSRVASSPDPNRFCVIANGAGYVVKAEEPEAWEKIPVTPVLDVRAVPEQGLLVFSDFTGLAAFDRNGLAWRSPRVCRDGLKIRNISRESIEGTGCDPTSSRESRFIVDLKTGRSLLRPPLSTDGKTVC